MINMNWPQIQAYVDKNALVLLPIGVIEEHGPQLCLGTDIYTAHLHCLFIKQRLEAAGLTVVIAPPFYWGICQSTGSFIGSFRVRKETMKALLFDILASLAGFGFRNVYGVNAHGDIEQNIAIVETFREATEQLNLKAGYAFSESILHHYGLTGAEPYICPVKPQAIQVSQAATPDVHAGDIETATIHYFYPELVDIEKARSLPPTQLGDDKIMSWLLGGQTADLSPNGYLGAPADFAGVDVAKNIDDIADRITQAILEHRNR
jgi:creatinine amidohydrolase